MNTEIVQTINKGKNRRAFTERNPDFTHRFNIHNILHCIGNNKIQNQSLKGLYCNNLRTYF